MDTHNSCVRTRLSDFWNEHEGHMAEPAWGQNEKLGNPGWI